MASTPRIIDLSNKVIAHIASALDVESYDLAELYNASKEFDRELFAAAGSLRAGAKLEDACKDLLEGQTRSIPLKMYRSNCKICSNKRSSED